MLQGHTGKTFVCVCVCVCEPQRWEHVCDLDIMLRDHELHI